MRDDIDSWSRPRLAERLKVVGLRAHVAGDARPQLTRRGDDDGEEHHGGEERPGAAWARSSFRSGHGRFSFIRASEVNLEELFFQRLRWCAGDSTSTRQFAPVSSLCAVRESCFV